MMSSSTVIKTTGQANDYLTNGSLICRARFPVFQEGVAVQHLKLLALSLLLPSCVADRKITSPDQAPASPNQSSKSTSGALLHLTMTASARFKEAEGWSFFESKRVPLTLSKKDGRYLVDRSDMHGLIGSMKRVEKASATPLSFTQRRESPSMRLVTATTSSDPETVADQFAEANYMEPDGSSDIYVDQATWEMLSGTTLSQDISDDGSVIATVVLDPISSFNPAGRIRLYLNGVEVASINPQYAATEGGWYTRDQASSAYSYYSGQQTASGNMHYEGPGIEPTRFDRVSPPQFHLRLPSYALRLGGYLGYVLLPKAANAQTCHECAPYPGGGAGKPNPCAFEQRGVFIGIITMLWHAHRVNYGGFILSTAGTVNFLHAYGRCAGRNPGYRPG
jgi:hypothetical protein